jgi:small subunit ribosomal protein S6
MRTYEVLFILSPQVTEEEATTLISDFKAIAEKNGAALKNEEAWGRRRLAYPIHKSNEGIYHLFVLESESSLSELDRRMKNVDRVLRHVIVRTDLEHKRAEKLAKRNPKKERVRPAVPVAAAAPAAAAPAPAADIDSALLASADETAPQA